MKAISLISTGIDSPVASYLLKKQGFEIIYLHLKIKNEGDEIIKDLIKKIDKDAKIIINDFFLKLEKIKQKVDDKYTCILCKRAMLKEAEKIGKKHNVDCIITGENLGQVASQTLSNMTVISSNINLPILRPLLCFEKDEIINIARKINTFNDSTKDTTKCPFVPINPVTKSKKHIIEILEKKYCSDKS
ncbi:MAG: hypothetical protein ACOC3X_01280 [Nanoarchaeota archaeon]